MDHEDPLQSEVHMWVQNKDPGLEWDLNQAQDPWAQVVLGICQVLDKDLVLDLVLDTFQRMA